MTPEQIREHLCAVLRAIQADSGHDSPRLSDQTVPLADLKDFDSLACVDAEVRLTERLGVEVEKVPFKSPETGREQSIAQIVAHLTTTYGAAARAKGSPSGPETK